MVGTGQEGTRQHWAGRGQKQAEGLGTAVHSRAGQGRTEARRQGRRMVQDSLVSATQRKAGQGSAGAGQVCVCVQVRSAETKLHKRTISKHSHQITSKKGKAMPSHVKWWSPLLLLGGAAFPSFGCCCFHPVFLRECAALLLLFGWQYPSLLPSRLLSPPSCGWWCRFPILFYEMRFKYLSST